MAIIRSRCCKNRKKDSIQKYLPLADSVDSPFSELPIELVLEIAKFLPPLPKLCLALTCKSLLTILDPTKSLQRSSQFRHPTGKMSERNLSRIFDADRWQLLQLLEDSRWRCCARCLQLHPVDQFSASDLAIEARQRGCRFGPMAGTVYLCPCMQITFRDKLRLIARLQQESSSPTMSAAQLQDSVHSSCWHECTVTARANLGLPKVRIRINPVLENGNNLVIETEFHITGLHWPGELASTGLLLCPHRGIDSHLRDLLTLDRGGRWCQGIEDLRRPRSITCKWCHTSITDVYFFPYQPQGPHYRHVILRTRRPLGEGGCCADEVWYNQTDLAQHRLHRCLGYPIFYERRPERHWARPMTLIFF
ncbi:hypothetical protein VTN77DRAFT_8108 [Rasamsonia byssochlamydoides]|uniref:uncharacterized protein n=1 Tax=Rasamsonia byssochlamydoides TaxID=89139 RepID=UPI0037440AB3